MHRLLGAAALLAALGKPVFAQSTPPAPAPTVGYIIAQVQPVYSEQDVVGRIQSPNIVNIQARVTGYLEAQNFTDGQAVKAGQLLYVIEQPPYQAQVDEAKGALAQAQAQARNATLSLKRAQILLHSTVGQQSAVDAAQASAGADTASVATAQAQLQAALINLGYTEIRSPIDGVIGATMVDAGNVVGPQSGVLATVVSEDPMYVNFALPMVESIENRANAAGLDVLVQLPDGSTYAQKGQIDFIGNQVTQNTDTLSWRASIANPDHALTDGEFVTVILRAKTARQQLVVPLGAVVTDQLGNYVLEVGPGNKVVRKPVVLGTETNTQAPILSGVAPGDKIITEGVQSIHPGITVNAQPAGGN
jgi:membrane fusion protein (multidrug efflux system)